MSEYSCAWKGSKEILDLSKKLDVHDSVLERVIDEYINKVGDANAFPTEDWVRSQIFPTSPVYSQNSGQEYIIANAYYHKHNREVFLKLDDADKEAKRAESYIPGYAVEVVRNRAGNYELRVAEPRMATKVTQESNQSEASKSKSVINWTTGQSDAITAINKHIADVRSGKKSGRYFLLEGKAGTGKTSILDEVIAGVKGGTFTSPTIAVGAPTHKASMVIGTKVKPGYRDNAIVINSSLDAMLGLRRNEKTGEFEPVKGKKAPIDSASVVILDEASMIDERKMEFLEQALKGRRVPVIFLGDRGQLSPVRSGSYYEGWSKKDLSAPSPVFTMEDIDTISLTQRVRQGNGSPILEYSDRFHAAAINKEAKFPDDRDVKSQVKDSGALIVQYNNVDLVKQLLPLFEEAKRTKNPNLVKIVTYTVNNKENKESAVNKYNRKIREALYPGSDPEDGFLDGDLVILNESYKPVGADTAFPNSTEGVVSKTEDYLGDDVKAFVGEELFKDLKLEEVKLQMVTMEYNTPNGIQTFAFPAVIPEEGNIAKHDRNIAKLLKHCKSGHSQDWGKYWSYKDSYGAKLGYAYAVTSHKSQGSTYDVVAVDLSDITSVGATAKTTKAQSAYVGITRASNVTIVSSPTSTEQRIFTDIKAINDRINSVKAGTASEEEFIPETEDNFDAPTELSDKEVNKTLGINPQSKSSESLSSQLSDYTEVLTVDSKVQEALANINAAEGEEDNYSSYLDDEEDEDEEETQEPLKPKTVASEKKSTPKTQKEIHENFIARQTLLNQVVDFNEDDHTYLVKGKLAKCSVTQFRDYLLTGIFKLQKKEEDDFKTYKPVSTKLGSTHDVFLRDYFMNNLQESYPNLNEEQMEALKKEAKKLKKTLQKKYGEKAIFITDESLLRVVANVTVNGNTFTIAGTMDMVVIPEDGKGDKPVIVDFKTMRANYAVDVLGQEVEEAEMKKEKKAGYKFQVSMYREMLQSNLSAPVGDTLIAQFNMLYAAPDKVKYSASGKQMKVGSKKIQDTEAYSPGVLAKVFGLSEDVIEENGLTIKPIKTDIQDREAGKETREKTQASKPVNVNYFSSVFSNRASKPFTIESKKGKPKTFFSVEQYVAWRKAVFAAKEINEDDPDYSLANKILYAKTAKQVTFFENQIELSKALDKKWGGKLKTEAMHKGMLESFKLNKKLQTLLINTGNAQVISSREGDELFNELLMQVREELGGEGAPKAVVEETKKAKEVEEEVKETAKEGKTSLSSAAEALFAQQLKEIAELKKLIEELKGGKKESTEGPEESKEGEESKESKESTLTEEEKKAKEEEEKKKLEEEKAAKEKQLKEAEEKKQNLLAALSQSRKQEAAITEAQKLPEFADDFFSLTLAIGENDEGVKGVYKVTLNDLQVIPVVNKEGKYIGDETVDITDRQGKSPKDKALDSLICAIPYSSVITLSGHANLNLFFTIDRLMHRDDVFIDGFSETITIDPESAEGIMAKEYWRESYNRRKKVNTFPYNPETGELQIPKFTIGFSRQEIEKRKKLNNLLNSNVLKIEEIRGLAKASIYKMSEFITMINNNVNGYEYFFKTDDASWENDPNKDKDFTKMSRIEVIQTIGIGNLMNLVRDRVFNVKMLDENAKKNLTRGKQKKMNLIANNWEAFRELAYDTLINLEAISLSDNENVKDDNNTLWDDETEDTILEMFGSSMEHWQVGFRQVSTFSSLSKLMKSTLDTIYQVDENGEIIKDEFGLGKHIDVQAAVSKILAYTQGARDINEMIDKLKDRASTEKWLDQVIEILEGKENEDGTFTAPNEQFRTQFFNNFKKYFLKYAITFKDNKKNIQVKIINQSEYSDVLVTNAKALENAFATGAFALKNKDGSINQKNLDRLTEISDKLESWKKKYPTKKKFSDNVDLDEYHALLKEAIDLLSMDKPEDESLYRIFGKYVNFKNFNDRLKHLVDSIKEGTTVTNLREYTLIAEIVSKEMGLEMESVAYESGKMHYSYVLPCYLGNLVGKLKSDNMSDAEYQEFLQNEYGRYKWFKNEDGYRNYWLDQISRSSVVRENLEHVTSLLFLGTDYASKTPAEYIASMMKMYFFDDNGKWAYYRMPMMSNKPSEEYLKFKRLTDANTGGSYLQFIIEKLHDVFYQELDRIQAVRERNGYIDNIDGIEKHLKINSKGKKATFDKNGLQFCFLDFLPIVSKETKDGKHQKFEATSEDPEAKEFAELVEKKLNGTLANEGKDLSRLLTLFEKLAKKGIDANYQVAREQWKEEGFLTETKDKEGKTVRKLFGKAKYSDEDLEEFFWNDMFAAINILQLTVTDTAYYVDTEDLQKRLAQLHAPGTRADVNATFKGKKFTADGIERTIYLQDDIIKSEIRPNLAKAFDDMIDEAQSDEERRTLESQKKSILAAFDEVNVADAQGYNSPTSYRKKMGVFGKWDLRMEDAYQAVVHPENLKEGESISDYLDILWLPLKPFVYSLVSLNGYNQTLPEIKVSVQNKNSEYVLILADAIMRSQGRRANRLSIIYDFMESTLLDRDGNPNGKGIDTVQFMSAVNAGCSGVIDLNDEKDKDGNIVRRLSEKEIKDKLSDALNKDGSYNLDYVHEIPFEDYMIQQEVPAHFRGHEQAHGSQDRILTFADIMDTDADGYDNYLTLNLGHADEKSMTVKEAKEQYFKAIADNIHESKQALIDRFNLNHLDPRARNKALSKVLKDTILKDSRFGSDLLWACDLNEYGEFNIPLSDPILSNRIQQLLNSIIKNEINKQEIAGGPVVQVTEWGTRDDLHIRFKDGVGKLLLTEEEFNENAFPEDYEEKYAKKKEGQTYEQYMETQAGVAYFECYVPILDENIAKDFTKIDENGNEYIDVKAMEKVNPKFLEMVGYRIPTESKYSMVPIKVKGFLPRTAGEGIMMPAEITSLAGSDRQISMFLPG